MPDQQLAPATRVVLAEDGVLLREGLAGLLQRFGFHVAAMAGDAGELHAATAEHDPDLVITAGSEWLTSCRAGAASAPATP